MTQTLMDVSFMHGVQKHVLVDLFHVGEAHLLHGEAAERVILLDEENTRVGAVADQLLDRVLVVGLLGLEGNYEI